MGVFRQFPYSNFHEMNMDEIIKIIKNMLEEWANYHAEWDQWMADLEASWTEYQDDVNAQWAAYQNTMNTAWQSMQNFINNYFDNLDVQEEINNKIVSMIQTGEFGMLVNEYIPPAVNAWLNLNITQPTGVVIDTSLTVAGACADAKATGDAISYLREDIFDSTAPSVTEVLSTDTFTALDGYVIGPDGSISPSSDYITFYKTFDLDTEIWFTEEDKMYYPAFLAISTKTGNTFTTRKRYIRNSEDNLPTEATPDIIQAHITTLYISCGKNATITYGNPTVHISYVPLTINNDVKLNSNQISQIENNAGLKSIKIQYKNDLNTESATEGLQIFIPTATGYILHQFVHSVDATINADIWRSGIAYAVDNNLSNAIPITTAGEWECAVKLYGRPDYSGGIAHGDEIVNNLIAFVDGKITDISSLTTLTECKELRIVERSTMYDPNDSETIIASHGSEHIYNKNGMTINQTLVWQMAVTAINAYMAMLPVAKSVTDTFFANGRLNGIPDIPTTIVDGTQYISAYANKASIFSELHGFTAQFDITEYPNGYNNGDYFILLDNGGSSYNKCYYAILNTTGNITYSIAPNTIWKSVTEYKFDKVN